VGAKPKVGKLTYEEQYQEVHKLAQSAGWAILKQMMQDEYEIACKKQNRPGPRPDDYEYMRGVLHSADQLMSMPDRVLKLFENNALIESASNKDDKVL